MHKRNLQCPQPCACKNRQLRNGTFCRLNKREQRVVPQFLHVIKKKKLYSQNQGSKFIMSRQQNAWQNSVVVPVWQPAKGLWVRSPRSVVTLEQDAPTPTTCSDNTTHQLLVSEMLCEHRCLHLTAPASVWAYFDFFTNQGFSLLIGLESPSCLSIPGAWNTKKKLSMVEKHRKGAERGQTFL